MAGSTVVILNFRVELEGLDELCGRIRLVEVLHVEIEAPIVGTPTTSPGPTGYGRNWLFPTAGSVSFGRQESMRFPRMSR